MDKEKTITILITPIEQEQFLLFQQYSDVFKTLHEKGIFSIGFGKATLNFAYGQLQNVIKEEVVYKKT